jgi:aminopeptidase
VRLTQATEAKSTVDPALLDQAAQTAVDRCLGLRPDETVVIVGDSWAREVSEAFWRASQERGSDSVLITIAEHTEGEPPSPVAAALLEADAFVLPVKGSLSHSAARAAATGRGVRGLTVPGASAEVLARLMAIDFDELQARSGAVAQLLDEADSAHLTCERGTEIVFDLTGRPGFSDDADVRAPGAFAMLPTGEGAIVPRTGEGTIAASAANPMGLFPEPLPSGRLPEPLMLTVEDGQLVAADGPWSTELLELFRRHGRPGTNLAELGVGTNPAAAISGNTQEDEKVIGTCHVAFGSSAGMPGGTVYAPVHRDLIVYDATLTVGDTQVLDTGQWVLDFPRT